MQWVWSTDHPGAVDAGADLGDLPWAAHPVTLVYHRPYLNAVGAVLTHAEIVFDKLHVLQHASVALTTCGGKNSFAPAR